MAETWDAVPLSDLGMRSYEASPNVEAMPREPLRVTVTPTSPRSSSARQGESLADILSMTHQAEGAEPRLPVHQPPYARDVENFARGGIAGVVEGRGGKLPDILPNWLIDALNNPDNQLAIGPVSSRNMPRMAGEALYRVKDTGLTQRLRDLKELNRDSVAKFTRTPRQDFGVTPEKSEWVTLPDGTLQRLYTGR